MHALQQQLALAQATRFRKHLLMAGDVGDRVALVQFSAGLHPALAAEVDRQCPESLTEAVRLARAAEFSARRGGGRKAMDTNTPAAGSTQPFVPRRPNMRQGRNQDRWTPARAPGRAPPAAAARAAPSGGQRPSIICHRCGKAGHVAAECRAPAPANNQGG